MQPEISKKREVKATNNKKTKEALASGKLQENQRKNVQKEIKKKKQKTNENQRKSVDEVEEQKKI